MKVAIAVFGSRVSPRCDCAREFVVVEISDGEIKSRERLSAAGMNELQVLKLMAQKGVTTIVGGAMPGFCHRMAEAMGMKIIQVSGGQVEDVIEVMKSGKMPEQFCGRRHRHGRHTGMGCPWDAK